VQRPRLSFHRTAKYGHPIAQLVIRVVLFLRANAVVQHCNALLTKREQLIANYRLSWPLGRLINVLRTHKKAVANENGRTLTQP
jgi:hypothetical protein